MKKEDIIIKYYHSLLLAIIPLVVFGTYKNGFYLYQKGYITFTQTFKPLILILMSIAGCLVGIIVIEKKERYNIFKNYKHTLINSLILALMLPLKTSPLIVFLIELLLNIFLKNTKINKVALAYLIIISINRLLGTFQFANIYEQSNVLNYNGLDLFIGFGIGGICCSSIILILIGLIYLSFNKLYKKNIALFSLITFILLKSITNILSAEYTTLLPFILGYNIVYSFVFVAPDCYTTSYTAKGQVLSGILLGILTYAIGMVLPYEASSIGILIINLLSSIIDRIFIVK